MPFVTYVVATAKATTLSSQTMQAGCMLPCADDLLGHSFRYATHGHEQMSAVCLRMESAHGVTSMRKHCALSISRDQPHLASALYVVMSGWPPLDARSSAGTPKALSSRPSWP